MLTTMPATAPAIVQPAGPTTAPIIVPQKIVFDKATYVVMPFLSEDFADLKRWQTAEDNGRWTPGKDGLVGEWLKASPSIFLKDPIEGDYLWQITATRLQPSADFVKRFAASKQGAGSQPRTRYNFNFWLRVADPAGEDFFKTYPKHLGTGWNGMGDDYWHSYFVTVVHKPGDNWIRLRRGPGYEKMEDVQNLVPYMDYNQPIQFSFLLRKGHVLGYFGSKQIFDHVDPKPYVAGRIGLCVWLDTVRFSDMRMYRFTD